MHTFKLWNNISGWAVFAVATIVYLLTMEPTTSLWDCSEFIATSYKLEVGHPPGAPLFMLLARVASLFAPTPAEVPMMINAMNAVASGLCIMFLHWTITHLARRITHREGEPIYPHQILLILGSGVVGALSYAFTDTFWFSAVEGEVYALSSMFTALVVWLMLKWEENAHRPTAMRWIILIAYLMGLSIGVHILNLLTIPALVMIWFFRRYECTSPKRYIAMMAAALGVSMLILGAINGLIIPYTVALGAAFDTFAVNTLGMPVNAGMLIFVVLVFAALAIVVWFTHSRRYRILNAVTLAVAVILIGFGSYAAVAIRANANPPMNSNNPSNPHMLLSLLNRDQYGNRPLLTGPYYSATPLPMVVLNDDITSDDQYLPTGDYVAKEVTWLNPTTGKYEEHEIFEDYIYPREAMHFMPRMWWHQRAKHYESGWVWTENGHPTQYASDASGNVWYEPTAFEDLSYFLDYQLGDMFVRYFMWNFVGRQDDVQLTTDAMNGIYTHGGWVSGIDFIDELFTGPTDNLPSDMADNRARNTYFFLPLLLGMLGIVYQMSSDWRNFIIVSLLFVMMGVALVVYFNTAPNEPRERDYVYAGAFYAFSIWIGLGATALGHLLSSVASSLRAKSHATPAIAVTLALLLSASVPTVLVAENWDDHDRSGRYYARDLGMNYLNTAPKNAILLNYGDNDTFPLWYCQEVEGIRPDVRVMNTSYLGGEWYIDEMKLAANDAAGVPFTIPTEKYSFRNDYVIVAQPIDLLMGDANVKLRAEARRILDAEFYTIYMPDTGQPTELTYDELESLYRQAQDAFVKYDSDTFYAYLMGKDVPQEDMQNFAEYQFALLILEEVEHNAKFLADMRTLAEYERKYRKMANADLYLKDAIRLFTHDGANADPNAPAEERALLLVINNGVMHIVESDKEIAPEERGADFEIMGRLNPKADNIIDGTASDYILAAKSYRIPVDRDAAIASGIVNESDRERMLDEISITISSSYLTKDYLMMLDLLAHFEWQRPLSFTQHYIMKDYGLQHYARYDGFCYTLVPIRTESRGSTAGYLDHESLYPIFMGEEVEGSHLKPLQYGNLADESVLCDYFTRFNLSATRLREGFTRVATAFIGDGNLNIDKARYAEGDAITTHVDMAIEALDKAEALLNRGNEVLPNSQVEYAYDNTYPYIRAYYNIATSRLALTLDEYQRAIALLNSVLGTKAEPELSMDDLVYTENCALTYNDLVKTASHRGITAENDNYAQAVAHGTTAEALFDASEEAYTRGDILSAHFIAKRGEWAKYYLQFGTLDTFSPTVNRELNIAMMDILDVLTDVSTIAGSYEWVANPMEGEQLAPNALQFDALAKNYIATIDRLTPRSMKDTQFALMEPHIFNIYTIYYYLDRSPQLGYEGPETLYHRDIVKFLSRPEVKAMIENYAHEYGMEVLEIM